MESILVFETSYLDFPPLTVLAGLGCKYVPGSPPILFGTVESLTML